MFFLPSAILSLDTENGDPLFQNVMFAQMGFHSFFYFKISMRCWDFNHVIDEV